MTSNRTDTGPGYRTEIVRTIEQFEALEPYWDKLPWGREEAAHAYFLTRLRFRPDVVGPYAIVVHGPNGPVAGLVGRLESRLLKTSLGYRTIYAPRVRLIQVVDGGIAVVEPAAVPLLVAGLRQALAAREADAVALPPLEVGSPLIVQFESIAGRLERQPFVKPWSRRLLVLPASFEQFVSSRSPNTRWRLRRDDKRLRSTFGERLSFETIAQVDGLERLVSDADRVAESTYQRALGAGFTASPEQQALTAVGLANGWVRGYLLYLDGIPIAYWLCSLFQGKILIMSTGFDAAYAEHRPGLYLLMRVVEEACADPSLHILDFGPGDAPYKQQFSNETREERNLLLFAPTWRARRINLTRTVILGPERLMRMMLDATNTTNRLKRWWRSRLRSSGA